MDKTDAKLRIAAAISRKADKWDRYIHEKWQDIKGHPEIIIPEEEPSQLLIWTVRLATICLIGYGISWII